MGIISYSTHTIQVQGSILKYTWDKTKEAY